MNSSGRSCHAILVDVPDCGCTTPGCCMTFQYCAEGGEADCSGPLLDDGPVPSCPDKYAPAYVDGRYEGCVHKFQCGQPYCPGSPPKASTPCGTDERTCYYEDCYSFAEGTGRTLAVCDHGAWAVTTGPCSSIKCDVDETYSKTYDTCTPGELCVYSNSPTGWITAECLSIGGCYGKAVTRECMWALPGTSRAECQFTYSVTGTTISCQELPPY
jgi:hypothetical protein